jgi:hypothetical protein
VTDVPVRSADGDDADRLQSQYADRLAADDAEAVEPLRRFAREHGSATAVVTYLGRRGARIVAVGADGAFGDAVVSSVAAGHLVCAEAGIDVSDEWTRELSDAIRFTAAERRRMGGS